VTPQLEPIGVPPAVGFPLIGVGTTKGYELINNRELDVHKIGRATRITLASLRAYVARQVATAKSPASAPEAPESQSVGRE
jgi:hypothetical protein